jgi:hypothetical protein
MAVSTTTAISWFSNYAFSSWYPVFNENPMGKVIVYAIMGISCLSAFAFTYRFIPETKDRTAEECVAMIKYAYHVPVTGAPGDEEVEEEEYDQELEELQPKKALLDRRPRDPPPARQAPESRGSRQPRGGQLSQQEFYAHKRNDI